DGAKHGSFQATIEPLWALAAMLQIHPIVKKWEDAAAKGSEFLLRHRIYKSKRNDSPVLLEFLTTHYPMHYRYDFLHGLRVLSELGAKYDPRMADAVNLLLQKRFPDGKWVLEGRSEEHTSELQSRFDLVCRLLLEKKKLLLVNEEVVV